MKRNENETKRKETRKAKRIKYSPGTGKTLNKNETKGKERQEKKRK